MRERRRELKRLQRSVRVYSDLASIRPPREFGHTHYSRMLVDDVANGIVPYGDSGFTVSFEPANPDVVALVAQGLDREDYYPHLSGSVRNFLREAAQTVLAFADAPYEIVYYSEPKTDKFVAFGLSFILPWTLKRKGGGWLQTIPNDYAAHLKARPEIELPSDSIFRLHLPKSISCYYARMMTDLDVLGRDLPPAFALPKPGEPAPDIGFDFQEWHKCHDIAVAQATMACGWNARNSFPKEVTEFYFVQRFLKFERFKLELRTSLLSQVNDLLQIVGKQLSFSGRIGMVGLPDNAQIDQSMQQLECSTASFTDVMKPYMQY
jgi:hypothetical protein